MSCPYFPSAASRRSAASSRRVPRMIIPFAALLVSTPLTSSCAVNFTPPQPGETLVNAHYLEPEDGGEVGRSNSEKVVIEVNDLPPINLVLIRAGTFVMGGYYARPNTIKDAIHGALSMAVDQGPKRRVTITKDFYLAQTETRVDVYCAFLNDVEAPEDYLLVRESSRIVREDDRYIPRPECADRAVDNVPWIGAAAFCEWLSERTGHQFRLPTEAEWEYAAFGSERRKYPWGSEFIDYYAETAIEDLLEYRGVQGRPQPWSGPAVGSCPKNVTPEGLFGMASNEAEWTSDWYAREYDERDTIDPKGPPSGSSKVLRGRHLTYRERTPASEATDDGYRFLGFRVLMQVSDD